MANTNNNPEKKVLDPKNVEVKETKKVETETENVTIKPEEVKKPEDTETLSLLKTNEPEKKVLAPNELIEVKKEAVSKQDDGNVLVQGDNVKVKVSPLTAKIISKFKK